jgi:hypothetical protein
VEWYWQEKTKNSETNLSQCGFPTTNPTWIEPFIPGSRISVVEIALLNEHSKGFRLMSVVVMSAKSVSGEKGMKISQTLQSLERMKHVHCSNIALVLGRRALPREVLNGSEISGSHGGKYEDYSHWDTAPCSLVEADRRFGGSYCLHRPDDGGSTHLWNVCLLLRDCVASHSRRPSYSSRTDHSRLLLHFCHHTLSSSHLIHTVSAADKKLWHPWTNKRHTTELSRLLTCCSRGPPWRPS